MARDFVRPTSSGDGWSDTVPDQSIGGSLDVEIRGPRNRVVLRYRSSSLALPVDVPIPIPLFKAIAGALLSGEAQAAMAPPPPPQGPKLTS